MVSGLSAQEPLRATDVPFDEVHVTDATALKQALAAIKRGDHLASKDGNDQPAAMEAYGIAYGINPDNADLNRKMGICALNGPSPASAMPWLERAAALEPGSPRIHYLLGHALQLNAKWDQAILAYEAHAESIRQSPDVDRTYNQAERRIAECIHGKALMAAPVNAVVTNMGPGVNGPSSDYGPLMGPDGVLYFTSRRSNTTGGKVNKVTNTWFEDIYTCLPLSGGATPPIPMPMPLNSIRNDATIALSADGARMIIYRDEAHGGDLFSSERNGEEWSEPAPMPGQVNSSAQESSAWPTADGKWLYFVSSRSGGVGGSDIYRCPWDAEGKAWGAAENLGPVVNSALDEDGVCLSPDGGTLYFASQGHEGMGGFDLYKTTFRNGAWSKPENFGWPINSPGDDQFLVMNATGTRGWFNSVRPGGFGDDDIYQVDLAPASAKHDVALLASTVGGGALDDEQVKLVAFIRGITMLEAMDAQVELLDLDDPTFSQPMELEPLTGAYVSSAKRGKNYVVHVSMKGYLPHSEPVAVRPATEEVEVDLDMKPIRTGSREVLGSILFDPDGSALEPASTTELDRLAAFILANPGLQLEIGGHTDNQASAEHNQRLSEARASTVVNYLQSRGVTKERLIAKGYGAKEPVAPNDSPENMRLNRRTEIKVL